MVENCCYHCYDPEQCVGKVVKCGDLSILTDMSLTGPPGSYYPIQRSKY